LAAALAVGKARCVSQLDRYQPSARPVSSLIVAAGGSSKSRQGVIAICKNVRDYEQIGEMTRAKGALLR